MTIIYRGFDPVNGQQFEGWCCDALQNAYPRIVDFHSFDNQFVIFEICNAPLQPDVRTYVHRSRAINFCPFCGTKFDIKIEIDSREQNSAV